MYLRVMCVYHIQEVPTQFSVSCDHVLLRLGSQFIFVPCMGHASLVLLRHHTVLKPTLRGQRTNHEERREERENIKPGNLSAQSITNNSIKRVQKPSMIQLLFFKKLTNKKTSLNYLNHDLNKVCSLFRDHK